MATLKTNTLTGTTTAGSIAVTGEGNSTTTNLQQGLIKVWVNYDGSASGAASRDSFNVSGMTDNGSGDYTTSFTNSMANTNYALLDGSVDDSSGRGSHLCGTNNTHATGSFRANYGVTGDASGDGNIPNDMTLNGSAFVGDLA
tara:strand:+ start:473 stop:901 length:429 start_codon:yes stop_codon:yes gene_type:complete